MTARADYVFVHGGGQSAWVWEDLIAAMAAHPGEGVGRLLAVDALGCGTKSSHKTEGLVMADVAADLIADIEAAGLEKVVLVGHSQAGQAMPVMAELRPDLFSHLVYVTCSAPLPGQSVYEMLGNSLQGENDEEVGWPVDPAVTEIPDRLPAMFCNDMNPGQAREFLERLGPDMWPENTYTQTSWTYDHLVGLPSTFVICERDRSLPAEWQERFARRLHAGRTIRIDAGHQVMLTQPTALAEIVLSIASRGDNG